MKKRDLLFGGVLILFLAGSWFIFQKMTDDTYEGMSIIPEQQEDIPLYDGLQPTDHTYVIDGNQWQDIYAFYLQKLPEYGWKLEEEDSVLNNEMQENNDGGFYLSWRKTGFNGELWISAHYNHYEEQTEVIFDQHSTSQVTAWIDDPPESLCIYETAAKQACIELTDQAKITEITRFINEAIDWNKPTETLANTKVIKVSNLDVTVTYEKEKAIYFNSEKGTKRMKPEPELLELLDTSKTMP